MEDDLPIDANDDVVSLDNSDEDMPLDTSRDVFYFTEGALAYAGHYLHAEDNPAHTHSFVEIAFAVGGTGTHHSVAGRARAEPWRRRPAAARSLARVRGLPQAGAVQLLLQQRTAAQGAVLDAGGPAPRLPAVDRAVCHAAGAASCPSACRGTPTSACMSHLEALAALRHAPARPLPRRRTRPAVAAAERTRPGRAALGGAGQAGSPARPFIPASGRRCACSRPASPGAGR